MKFRVALPLVALMAFGGDLAAQACSDCVLQDFQPAAGTGFSISVVLGPGCVQGACTTATGGGCNAFHCTVKVLDYTVTAGPAANWTGSIYVGSFHALDGVPVTIKKGGSVTVTVGSVGDEPSPLICGGRLVLAHSPGAGPSGGIECSTCPNGNPQ